MSGIDFGKKMSFQRPLSSRVELNDEYEIIQRFESDRGRLINSAAVRRLQQKTQVFPLERNASVRSRLTHSMEVQQVGRYIAKEILNQLKKDDRITELSLDNYIQPFESLVETACLMHDLGNPPFGHFGEAAINNWFRQHLKRDVKGDYHHALLGQVSSDESELANLKQKIADDLCHFEGNAQAIRLVHSLLKLNLTYSQVACILKYTRPAYWNKPLPASHDYLMKKPGFYLAEEPFIIQLRQELAMAEGNRYPLAYIMEAADDISYCIADLEDAVEKAILTVPQLYEHLKTAWGEVKPGDLFSETVDKALQKLEVPDNQHSHDDRFFMYLRVNTIGKLVPHAARRFIDNLPAIYDGVLNEALLEDSSEQFKLLTIYKQVALRYVFNSEEVEQLELQGYQIITGLLNIYSGLLTIPHREFSQLVQNNWHPDYPIETRLFHKLSNKHRVAYGDAVALTQALPKAEQALWEFYYRARLLQDYVSGMTDLYAYDEYRKLMVAG